MLHKITFLIFVFSQSDLFQCQPVSKQEGSSTLHFIELTIRADINAGTSGGSSQEPIKRPLVRCSSDRISVWVSSNMQDYITYSIHAHFVQQNLKLCRH